MGSRHTENRLDGVMQGDLDLIPDDKWVPSSTVHNAPVVKVSEPTGAFCQMDSTFSVPLPPDDVYDIIIDPNNRRVFKNVKFFRKKHGVSIGIPLVGPLLECIPLGEVTYRKIIEDDGNCQVVEVEQLGRWQFLLFSGTFTCRVLVKQNRKEHTMQYDLARQGMMKKFFGKWKIEPIYETEPASSTSDSSIREQNLPTTGTAEKHSTKGKLTGSWVILQQSVQPAIVPPWPLSKYIRGISGRVVQDVCADLQLEAIRLADLKASADNEKNSDMHEVD